MSLKQLQIACDVMACPQAAHQHPKRLGLTDDGQAYVYQFRCPCGKYDQTGEIPRTWFECYNSAERK